MKVVEQVWPSGGRLAILPWASQVSEQLAVSDAAKFF